MEKLAIVIQGPSTYVNQIKKWYTGYPLIFSTWVGEEKNYDLKKDIVVFNDKPLNAGPANFWMQQYSTIQGLYKAKELGYTDVLKMRSDIVPTNLERFVSTFKDDHLNFFCWHGHEVYPRCPGYFVDYFMYGNIEHIIKLWDIEKAFCAVPEIILTWQYIKTLSDIPINFIYSDISTENDLYWIKRNMYLSSYKTPIVDPYNKFTFNLNVKNINNHYLDFLEI
jgi:hypothetical protein